MTSLNEAMKRQGKTKPERDYILSMQADYQKEGLSGKEAALKVIEDLKDESTQELKSVSGQINQHRKGTK